ncbi:MAG: DUF4097 family beta strand repeat-containing protein [Bacillota bacterium]
MDLKRLSLILAGIALIAFGVGIYSLIYIDNFNVDDIAGEGGIVITDNGDAVEIDSEGIRVNEDGKSVSISWDGIEIIEDGKKTVVGLENLDFLEHVNIFSNLKSYSADESHSINITENVGAISIYSTFANTRVITSDTDELVAYLEGNYRSNREVSLDIQDLGSNIKISVTPASGGFTVARSNLQLEIHLPENYNKSIHFTSSSANFEAEALHVQDVIIETSSGNIKVEEMLSEESSIQSSSGEIEIPKASGKISITCSSGNVSLGPVEPLVAIKVSTSSGDMHIGPLEGLSLEVKGTTSSGRISYEGAAASIQNDGDNLSMTLQEGEYTIDLTSSSGNITLFE